MTIDEATRKLEPAIMVAENEGQYKLAKAMKLGEEALREVKRARYGDPALDGELLPGETKE